MKPAPCRAATGAVRRVDRSGRLRTARIVSTTTSPAAPAGVGDGGDQRPAEEHVAESARRLPRDDRDQCEREATRVRALRMQSPRQESERRQHDRGAESMRHVDRGQRRERQIGAVAGGAERALHGERRRRVHVRPPRALAGGKVAARQDGVVAADPAAERDLRHDQCGDDEQARAESRRERHARVAGIARAAARAARAGRGRRAGAA